MQRPCYYMTYRNCVRKKTKKHIAWQYRILNACRRRRFGGRKSFNFQLNINLTYCWDVCIVCAHAGLFRKDDSRADDVSGLPVFFSFFLKAETSSASPPPALVATSAFAVPFFFFFFSRCLLGKQCAGNGLYRPHSCFFVTITQRAGCDISTSSAYATHSRTALENVVL